MSDRLPRRTVKGYGWRPDLPDARDLVAFERVVKLPARIDMRSAPAMPKVWDQGNYGSCTAHGCGGVMAFELSAEKSVQLMPARFWLYSEERLLEGTALGDDSGAQVRDGMKVMAKLGIPPEGSWPYTARNFARKPTASSLTVAAKHRIMSYRRVSNRTASAALQVLAAGHPIAFGFTVYDSFESDAVAASGIVPMPDLTREQVVGGHCVMAVGYDQTTKTIICRNSWGKNWGMDGYFTMPFDYAFNTELSDDWWMASVVE